MTLALFLWIQTGHGLCRAQTGIKRLQSRRKVVRFFFFIARVSLSLFDNSLKANTALKAFPAIFQYEHKRGGERTKDKCQKCQLEEKFYRDFVSFFSVFLYINLLNL